MKNLLREIEDFDKTSIDEAKSKGENIKFSTPFMTSDSKNKNNRRYPFEILDTAIKEFSSKVKSGKGFGADSHPASGNVEISDISHRITKVFMKDKVAHIEGEILPGEKGKKILDIISSGGVLGVSARGFGEMKKAKDGVNEIQKGYFLGGIDFIVNPSEDVATIDKKNILESAPVEIEEAEFFSLRTEIESAVKIKAGKKAWVTDFSDKEIIYRIFSDGSEIDSEGTEIFYKISYKISGKEVELTGEPNKVEKIIQYENEMTKDEILYQQYIREISVSQMKISFEDYKKIIKKE